MNSTIDYSKTVITNLKIPKELKAQIYEFYHKNKDLVHKNGQTDILVDCLFLGFEAMKDGARVNRTAVTKQTEPEIEY